MPSFCTSWCLCILNNRRLQACHPGNADLTLSTLCSFKDLYYVKEAHNQWLYREAVVRPTNQYRWAGQSMCCCLLILLPRHQVQQQLPV